MEQNKLPGFFYSLGLSEFTVFKRVQKAVYSVRNKPVYEFKNWCGLLLYKDTSYTQFTVFNSR